MAKAFVSLLLIVATSVGMQGIALADPWPDDSPNPSGPAVGIPNILPTLPFQLGEVGTTALGVSDTELAGVGLSGIDPADSATSSSGSLLTVDDDLAQCPHAQYMSIQVAVTAALPGDQIKVCAGTYSEQVLISTGKDGLTLFSEVPLAAVIQAPPTIAADVVSFKSIVRVSGAQNVTIRHFTITGPGPGICDSIRYGVRVDSGGSATIAHNHITKIHDTPFSGCQTGHAVNIGRFADGQVGSGIVRQNLIDEYQKGGVLVEGLGSRGDVRENEVRGVGPTPVIAQNGIVVNRHAHADIHHNRVSGNRYTGGGFVATGILPVRVDQADEIAIHHNETFSNDVGIAPFFADAIDVAHNRSHDNTESGIHAFPPSPTQANTIEYNDSFNNAVDCKDDTVGTGTAGTANLWIKDKGNTENRMGICKKTGP